jgi:DNA integrity scanning protein DisA with diadenylate cyclase activity
MTTSETGKSPVATDQDLKPHPSQLTSFMSFFQISAVQLQDQLLAGLFYLRSLLTISHLLDIILTVALLIVLYRLLKGTQLLRSLYLLIYLLLGNLVAQLLGLQVLSWLLLLLALAWFLSSVITSADELTALYTHYSARARKILPPKWVIRDTVLALTTLKSSNLSAVIIFRRGKSLKSFVSEGLSVNQLLSRDLLVNSFSPKSHLRKGAALVEGDRVISLGVAEKKITPATTNAYLRKIASQFDAVVVTLNRAGTAGVLAGKDSYSNQRFSELESLLLRLLK